MRIARYRIPEILGDGVLLACAFALAFFLRFEFSIPPKELELLKTFILPIIVAKLIIFYFAGLYRRTWRYASIRAFLIMFWASALGTLAAIVIIFYIYRSPFPRSVVAIDGILTLALVGGIRFISHITRGLRPTDFLPSAGKPVLIVGAGDTGGTILYEMVTRPKLGYRPIGLIDDAPEKQGMYIHNVKVLGTREQLKELINKHGIEEVIVCMPTASREVIQDVFLRCREAGVACKTLPGIYQLIDGSVTIGLVREIGVEDILGREPVRIDLKKATDLVAGKSVLVTGASGSIGSELCRQIYRLGPSSLIVVDQSESGLFQIEQELSMRQGSTLIKPIIADVTHQTRVKAIFDKHRPSIVFHAAAYKHVPMMETCIAEALENNLLGTKMVAETAIQFGADKFVFVSTDKAVEPISIMGISKALAEKLVQAFTADNSTRFMIVRFGNVLDSSGSVVPIFRQQIARGGPVTVTHPDMTRYFMTIPEAMQLVVQATAMGQGGEVFILDMGEQVSIVDLARHMIKLSGFEPDKDIPIAFTGIRPGEKLHEKLFWDHEEIMHTEHKKVLMVKNTRLDIAKFKEDIRQMEAAISSGELEKIQETLSQMCTYHLCETEIRKGTG